MKRSLNILLATILSLMVVFLSVGTTFMYCLRYNTVKIGGVMMTKMDCCAKKAIEQETTDKCTCCHAMQQGKQWKNHCMEYKLVKLSPTLSVQKMDFDATPVFAGIQPGTWALQPRPIISNIQKTKCWSLNVPHSPPRAYLTLLNTLII